MEWRSEWIWDGGAPSPRNAWRCFRGTHDVPAEEWDGARLRITADSRYVLWVNGERVGRGPARGWPWEQPYDTHDVGHLLRPGEQNVVAVLVHHFGVSTFSYIRGRGGLLAQLELLRGGEVVRTEGTGGDWKTYPHEAYDSRAPRMSCMLAFAEVVDARAWDDAWLRPGYDDAGWEAASVLGPVGVEPWTAVAPKEIPHLAEEAVRPARVLGLAEVERARYAAWVDVRAAFAPGSADHADYVDLVGYVGTVIRAAHAGRLTLGFPGGLASVFGPCYLNGVRYGPEAFGGTPPERYLEVELVAGDNLLLVDVSGREHGRGLFLLLDADEPFELVCPTDPGDDGSEFAVVGPFVAREYVDYRPPEGPPPDARPYPEPAAVRSADELLARYGAWVRPMPAALVDPDNVLGHCIHPRSRSPHPVPAWLQGLAAGLPTPMPSFEGRDVELVVDFGRELSGYLEWEVEAPEGAVLELYGWEYVGPDGWRQDMHDVNNTVRYTCRAGRQRYASPVRRGLRYLMVTVRGASGPVTIHSLRMLQSNYPVAEVGAFRCSDPLLDEVWRISRDTTRLCMEDTYVDCPAFEQTYWVGDSRPQALCNAYVFGADALTRRSLRLVAGSMRYTPLVVNQVPSGWHSVIPSWSLLWMLACEEYWRRTGDVAFAREMWPHVRDALDAYLEHLDERGLFAIRAWNQFDWAPSDQPRTGAVAHQNMFLVRALRAGAALAGAAGDAQGEGRCAAAAERLRGAIDEHLWEEGRGAYIDCIHEDGRRSATLSVHPQFLALLFGIPSAERVARVARVVVEPPEDFVPIASPFASFFLYEALGEAGRLDAALADMRRGYGEMLEHDATTCWEGYPRYLEYPENPRYLTRSHCHGWSAAPTYVLPAYVLGVRGAAPGWTRVLVAPQPGDLAWARGSVPLPGAGRIDVAWRLEGEGRMRLEVEAPARVGVDARLPAGYEGQLVVRAV